MLIFARRLAVLGLLLLLPATALAVKPRPPAFVATASVDGADRAWTVTVDVKANARLEPLELSLADLPDGAMSRPEQVVVEQLEYGKSVKAIFTLTLADTLEPDAFRGRARVYANVPQWDQRPTQLLALRLVQPASSPPPQPDPSSAADPDVANGSGCGCATDAPGGTPWALVGLGLLARRRTRG